MKFIVLGFLSLASTVALAGGASTGGGGVVVCPKDNSVELFDYYEARTLRNITEDLGSSTLSYMDKVKYVLNRLAAIDPARAGRYWARAQSFAKEAAFIPNANLNDIGDSQGAYLPTGCTFAQAAAQHPPQFPGDPYYIVSKDLWDMMSDDNKAGLMLHEISYREGIAYGHQTSTLIRYYNSQISSAAIQSQTADTYLQLLNSAALPTQFLWMDPKSSLWWYSTSDWLWNDEVSSDPSAVCDPIGARLPTRLEVGGAYPGLGAALTTSGVLDFTYTLPDSFLQNRGGFRYYPDWAWPLVAIAVDTSPTAGVKGATYLLEDSITQNERSIEGTHHGREMCVSTTNPVPIN
jgi:hypothetical protein